MKTVLVTGGARGIGRATALLAASRGWSVVVNYLGNRARRLGSGTPLGRPGRPEEIAEAIVWLLSDAASYTTSATLDVAGGR